MNFFLSFCLSFIGEDEEEDKKSQNRKHYRKIGPRRSEKGPVIGANQKRGDHSDDNEEYSSALQDFSDNDLDDEEDDDDEEEEEEEEEEDEEDMEECHEDDNVSSTICDDEDPRLCSPSTDSEDKNSPPKFNKANISCVTSKIPKNVKSKPPRGKSKSPDGKLIGITCQTAKIKDSIEGQCSNDNDNNDKADTEEKISKSEMPRQIRDIERAKSLPPDVLRSKTKSLNISTDQLNAKKRKRKSRPSSSSSMIESNSEKEEVSQAKNYCSQISSKHSTDKLKSKKKRTCPMSVSKQKLNECQKDIENFDESSEISIDTTPLTKKETTKCAISTQMESLSKPAPLSNKATNSIIEARSVWWASEDNHSTSLATENPGGDRTSSVGSTPMISPEISIGQWPNGQCISPSQSGCCPNAQAAALAAAAASNSALSPPPPGPSTAMAELANLVNAHPRAGVGISGETVHDMRPFLRNLAVHQQRWNAVEDSHGSVGNNVSCGISDDNESGTFRFSISNKVKIFYFLSVLYFTGCNNIKIFS